MKPDIQAKFDELEARISQLESNGGTNWSAANSGSNTSGDGSDNSDRFIFPIKLNELERKSINNVFFYVGTAILNGSGNQTVPLPSGTGLNSNNIILTNSAVKSFIQDGDWTFLTAGVGYTAGDILTVTGGNGDALLEVDTVDGSGHITNFDFTDVGSGYTNGTYSTTGGSGTGASFIFNTGSVAKILGGGGSEVVYFIIFRTSNLSSNT